LLTADKIFEKMGKSNSARRELMHQMKLYRTRQIPFDIDLGSTELPISWWISMEDNFNEGEDYLVQLATKLYSVTPHAAGCERVWSNLGWVYGKRRNRLGLNKVENMYKLSAYYNAHAKQELPYYSIEKTSDEICEILVDAHLNPDEDFIEILEDANDIEVISFDEEDNLTIGSILNLDASSFINNLDEIVEDSLDEDLEEEQDNVEKEMEMNIDGEWDPIAEADDIVNS
jgi:hypothetical protein